MTKIAGDVTIRAAESGENVLLVDGEPFPWHVLAEDIDVVVGFPGKSVSTLTLTIPFTGNLHSWGKADGVGDERQEVVPSR